VIRRRPVVIGLGVLAAGLAAVACQVVAGIEHVEKEPAHADSASPDSSDGKSDATVDPCAHVQPPEQPSIDDDRDTELPPFYLALRTINVVAKEGNSYRGFDLDGVCTCDRRPETANGGLSSCKPMLKDCDLDGGIDNKAASLFEQFAPTGFSPSDSANKSIVEGRKGLLLYVKGYNGKPNDRQISVGVMVTYGIADGSGCGTSTGDQFSPPGWCGNDLWTYPVEFVKPTTKEPVYQGNGYVANGTLVFRSDLPITMFFGSATLTFGSPVTAGSIKKNAAGIWTFDGILAGRIPATELLAASGTFKDPGNGSAGLCNSPFFATVKKTLCESVDINRTSALDFQAGNCDAISSAMSFTAEQASIGAERTEPPDSNPCAKDQVDPALYTCP
jgi:hypothetical protein